MPLCMRHWHSQRGHNVCSRANFLFAYLHNLVSLKHLCEYGGLTRAEAYFAGLIPDVREAYLEEVADDE